MTSPIPEGMNAIRTEDGVARMLTTTDSSPTRISAAKLI